MSQHCRKQHNLPHWSPTKSADERRTEHAKTPTVKRTWCSLWDTVLQHFHPLRFPASCRPLFWMEVGDQWGRRGVRARAALNSPRAAVAGPEAAPSRKPRCCRTSSSSSGFYKRNLSCLMRIEIAYVFSKWAGRKLRRLLLSAGGRSWDILTGAV